MTTTFKPAGLPKLDVSEATMSRLLDLAAYQMYNPTHMAIVDYLGFTYQDHDGSLKTVTETTEFKHRYGTRSMQHVNVYGFKVIWKNLAAQRAEFNAKQGA